jgi:hypothetical protein
MALSFATTVRSARSTAIVTAAGTGATMKFYNGTKPASLGAITTQTLLATLTFTGALGTVSSGVLTLGAISQTNSGFVSGTPTWVRISTSGSVIVLDVDIGAGASNLQFTGAVTNGVNITLSTSTITEGNL